MTYVGRMQQFVDNGSPWYVRNKNLGTLIEAAALVMDAQLETLNQGLRLSQPLRCDESALSSLSLDRGISIYPTEPTDSKRFRLSRWWQLRRQFGTHQGELRNVAPYFLPVLPLMRIVHQDGVGGRATWHTLGTDGVYSIAKTEPSNWDFDGATSKWSRWWAIVYRDPLMAWLDAAEYDDGTTYDSGVLWDGGPSSEQIDDIVSAFQEAQAPHSMLWGVIVTTDPASFDPAGAAVTDPTGWTSLPTGNWGALVDPATGLPTRPPYATWIYDRGQG